MQIKIADRIENLPPYFFAELDRKKELAISQGKDIIDLAVGDPDIPTPAHIIEKLKQTVEVPENQRYPCYEGLIEFRQAVADWYHQRFGVSLDPETEVLLLMGSKDGEAHILWALVDPKDIVLLANPHFPMYRAHTIFTHGLPYDVPLLSENGFLPNLDAIPPELAKRAKLLFINYPHNPTGAVADEEFYTRLIDWAYTYQVIILNSAVYSEIAFDGYKPLSILQTPGAKDIAIEFHSLSKTYNMAGWRIGFAVGNRELIRALLKIKMNTDSGVFYPIQHAGIAALRGPQDCVEELKRVYQQRRDILVQGLNEIGLYVEPPKATFYIWVPVPRGYTSIGFAELLLASSSVHVVPGIGFGEYGEGYVRFSLTVPTQRIKEAVERMKQITI